MVVVSTKSPVGFLLAHIKLFQSIAIGFYTHLSITIGF